MVVVLSACSESTTEQSEKEKDENQISVVSYNIRGWNDPDGNAISDRAPRLEQVLDKYSPDLIGFQEFVPEWETYTTEMLGDEYGSIVQYRGDTGKVDEAAPIFYKKEVLELVESGAFWMSNTPEKSSASWSSQYHRICTWAKFKIIETGKEFYHFNTHTDGSDLSQYKGAHLIIEKREEICGDLPLVITGDFNMIPESIGYSELTTVFADVNAVTTNSTDSTYHNYGADDMLIDYCFITSETIKAVDYKIMDDMVDDKYVSDHFGLYTEMIIGTP